MKKSVVGGITALILAGALAITAGIGSAVNGKWFKNPDVSTWFDSWGKGEVKPNEGNADNSDVDLLHVTEDKGISLMSARIASEDYGEYGIEAQADTAYSIKASVNSDAVDKSVVGSIAFKNPSSAWASGKLISDYVVLNQTTEYGLDFTLTVKQSFGEPIIFKVASCMDSSVNATAQIDYLKELMSFTATLNPSLSGSGRLYVGDTSNTVQITPTYGVGTVEGTISRLNVRLTLNQIAFDGLKSRLTANSKTRGYSVKSSISITDVQNGFKIPLNADTFLTASGSATDASSAGIIINNFIKEKGYNSSTAGGSVGSLAGVGSIRYSATYTYNNDYSVSQSIVDSSVYQFRTDGLTAVKTITNISLDKTNIVVYPA